MQLTYRFASYEYSPEKPQGSIASMPGERMYRGIKVQTAIHAATSQKHGVHNLKYRGVTYEQ
ncbi:DUF4278 domain-containing protein [Thermoleptolyngbya sp. M55_K2018_002]|jgi:hypothetical protein|uniref:DUF4278 domain-containing protein n=1 Tax=Thermoleptolyngbya sp. M55_K2018_002 TaxID=2747808 RepID=UPI001A07475B|nr:DUF4278 domain-containing protein [Thermoleptolyngbya sp. M55_K2018_002]HIK40809.1 DUF4278 domain-containing protein [Thermoleptolyngbya sp. M55_K2018_002]